VLQAGSIVEALAAVYWIYVHEVALRVCCCQEAVEHWVHYGRAKGIVKVDYGIAGGKRELRRVLGENGCAHAGTLAIFAGHRRELGGKLDPDYLRKVEFVSQQKGAALAATEIDKAKASETFAYFTQRPTKHVGIDAFVPDGMLQVVGTNP
jgi:hypothetical protein